MFTKQTQPIVLTDVYYVPKVILSCMKPLQIIDSLLTSKALLKSYPLPNLSSNTEIALLNFVFAVDFHCNLHNNVDPLHNTVQLTSILTIYSD